MAMDDMQNGHCEFGEDYIINKNETIFENICIHEIKEKKRKHGSGINFLCFILGLF